MKDLTHKTFKNFCYNIISSNHQESLMKITPAFSGKTRTYMQLQGLVSYDSISFQNVLKVIRIGIKKAFSSNIGIENLIGLDTVGTHKQIPHGTFKTCFLS